MSQGQDSTFNFLYSTYEWELKLRGSRITFEAMIAVWLCAYYDVIPKKYNYARPTQSPELWDWKKREISREIIAILRGDLTED